MLNILFAEGVDGSVLIKVTLIIETLIESTLIIETLIKTTLIKTTLIETTLVEPASGSTLMVLWVKSGLLFIPETLLVFLIALGLVSPLPVVLVVRLL